MCTSQSRAETTLGKRTSPFLVTLSTGGSSLNVPHSFDEDFVRNFYGYLSSQTMAGKAPNPFQMLRFLDAADVILVAPLPFSSLLSRFGVVSALGSFFNVVLGK